MHMLPPQAPPAIEQTTYQEATDAVARLTASQHVLDELQARLPEPVTSSMLEPVDGFLDRLSDAWHAPASNAPGATVASARATLSHTLANIIRDEAILRQKDGTLSERASQMATTFARSVSGSLSGSLHARELLVADGAYAGAVILTDDQAPDLALLFHPTRGLDEFPDLDTLHRAAEARIRTALAHEMALPGMVPADRDRITEARVVSSRVIEGDAFDVLAGRLIDVQEEQIDDAWPVGTGATATAAAHRLLADDVLPLLRLQGRLDVDAILAARQTRLFAALAEERLAPLPTAIQDDWRRAASALGTDMRIAAEERASQGISEPQTVEMFARGVLKTRLAAMGITEDPDDIVVDIYPMPTLETPGAVYAAWVNGIQPPPVAPVDTLPLAGLAMRNIGYLDRQTFRARDDKGRNLAPALDHAAIKTLVREVDIGTTYREYLQRTLQSSPQGVLTRQLATRVARARMDFELADARVAAYTPGEARPFLDDHLERGYHWVKAVLDQPAATACGGRPDCRRVERHEIVVRQLTYRGVPMKDVLVIGVRNQQSISRVVLYTPDAPDGQTFREFEDRRSLALGVLYNPAFETYLLDRLPSDAAKVEANGVRHFRLSNGDRRAHWAMFAGNTRYVRTDEPFSDRVVEGNFLEAAYDTSVSLMTRNLERMARPTHHADYDNVTPRIDGEAIARGLSHLIGRPFMASWRAYDAVKAGDTAQAFVDLTDAYVASLDHLGLSALKPLLIRSIGVRTAANSRHIASTGKTRRDPATVFEKRFVSPVAIPADATTKHGVYTLDGKHFIRQEGKTYRVRFDDHAGHWRLDRPGAIDANYTGPAIARHPDGMWRHQPVGLRGGDPGDTLGQVPRAVMQANEGRPSFDELSRRQRRIAGRMLRDLAGRDEAGHILRQVTSPFPDHLPHLTPAQWTLLDDAVFMGMTAPPRPPRGPRHPPAIPRPPVAQPARSPATAPVSLQEVARGEWPAAVWHYPGAGAPPAQGYGSRIMLAQSRINASGARGIPVFTANPNTPWPALQTLLQGPPLTPSRPHGSFPWIRIDLARLQARTTANGTPAFSLFRMQDGTEVRYLLRRNTVTARRHAVTLAWLEEGEFVRGRRFVLDPTGQLADAATPVVDPTMPAWWTTAGF